MAYIEITGIDNVMAQLADEGSGFRGRATRALEMAAGELREQLQQEEALTFIAPTGELGDTIGWKKISFSAGSAEVLVHFIGDYQGRRKGPPRRAGFVAAMVEYKHRNPWNRRAMNTAAPRINSILQEELSVGHAGIGSDWGGL